MNPSVGESFRLPQQRHQEDGLSVFGNGTNDRSNAVFVVLFFDCNFRKVLNFAFGCAKI